MNTVACMDFPKKRWLQHRTDSTAHAGDNSRLGHVSDASRDVPLLLRSRVTVVDLRTVTP